MGIISLINLITPVHKMQMSFVAVGYPQHRSPKLVTVNDIIFTLMVIR